MAKKMNFVKTALLAAGLTLTHSAMAAWPSDHPIEVYVGYAAGGSTDVMARAIAPYIEKYLGDGANIIVVNRPGASGERAVTLTQNAKPDGYTMGIVNLPGYFFVPMYREAQYDTSQVQLLARVVSDPTVLAVLESNDELDSLDTVINKLKENPGSISAGHNGVGTNGHLAIKQLEEELGIEFNTVPYKGTGEQRTDLLGGHLDLAFIAASEVLGYEGGSNPMRLLAQATDERIDALDYVPTTKEQDVQMTMTAERGFAIPMNVPTEIRERLENAIKQAMEDPDYIKSAMVDAPFLDFLGGDEWTERIENEKGAYVEMAKEVAESM